MTGQDKTAERLIAEINSENGNGHATLKLVMRTVRECEGVEEAIGRLSKELRRYFLEETDFPVRKEDDPNWETIARLFLASFAEAVISTGLSAEGPLTGKKGNGADA